MNVYKTVKFNFLSSPLISVTHHPCWFHRSVYCWRFAFYGYWPCLLQGVVCWIRAHIKREQERYPRQTLTSYPQHVFSHGAQPINPWPIDSQAPTHGCRAMRTACLPSGYPIGLVKGGQSVMVMCFLLHSSLACTVVIITYSTLYTGWITLTKNHYLIGYFLQLGSNLYF